MSAWSEKAEQIKARLESLVALKGVTVIIDRQKDFRSVVEKQTGSELGACVTILWEGGALDVDPAKRQTSSPNFLISVIAQPIAMGPCCMADDLVEAAACGLHGHVPTATGHCHDEFRVAAPIALVDHPKYLIYAFPLTCRVTHPEVQIQPS